MTQPQMLITIGVMALSVAARRALPFILFPSEEKTPRFVRFLGKYLASAVFGMLVVYCLKDISFGSGHSGIPQLLGIGVCVFLHRWRKNMLLTIAGGTIIYMWLVQTWF